MQEILTGHVNGCFANKNPLEEEVDSNFLGHIALSTDGGNCDIQTDNPASYLMIETKVCVSTPISLPVERHEDHFHLMLSNQP